MALSVQLAPSVELYSATTASRSIEELENRARPIVRKAEGIRRCG